MGKWNRYWFRSGGRTSAAALRIAIGLSILWMLWRLHNAYYACDPDHAPHLEYRPVGILRVLPCELGSTSFDIVWTLAWASTLAMILGVWSRAATGVSFATALVLVSYEYSFKATWSHDNNAPLLAQLAFLGARGGDALSLDAWWRRRRGIAIPDRPYLWSVQLVQIALAIMMASAAFSKLVSGGTSFAWVFSDNLRNHILVRFDFNEIPRTALAEWILGEPWRWKLVAFSNVVAQLAPLAACFACRRPVVRAVLGSVFAIETIALDAVMGFPNYHWLPLVAAFIDWDRIAARFGVADAGPASPRRAPRIFVIAFLACDIPIAFWRWPKLDQRIGAYPLSSFPMFATIRARPPYDQHFRYELPVRQSRFDVTAATPLSDRERDWIENRYGARNMGDIRDCEQLRREIEFFDRQLHDEFPQLVVRSTRAVLVAFAAPPYPEPARLDRIDIANLAELEGEELHCAIGESAASVAYYVDGCYVDKPVSRAEIVTRSGSRWFLVGNAE